MSRGINSQAATTYETQGLEQSDRNPQVANWNGTDSEGGPLPTPASAESRVTAPGPAPSPDAGLVDYGDQDSGDAVENEAERES
jgi:hypothetical protein